MSRRIISDQQLGSLFAKYGGQCAYGGRNLTLSHYGQRLPTGWEVDHATPISAGGVDDGRNHRVTCWACNRLKGDWDADQWRYRLREYYGGTCPRWYNGEPVKKHP